MENLDVLFALISMAERIYLIARSRIAEVNVGTIARDLGGGGHASAASATLKDMTLIEAEEKLILPLHRHIQPQPIAARDDVQPAIAVPPEYHRSGQQTSSPATTSPSCRCARDRSARRTAAAEVGRRHHLPHGGWKRPSIHDLGNSAGQRLHDHRDRDPAAQRHPGRHPGTDHRESPAAHSHCRGRAFSGVITRTDLLNRLVNDPPTCPRICCTNRTPLAGAHSATSTTSWSRCLNRDHHRAPAGHRRGARKSSAATPLPSAASSATCCCTKRNLDLDIVIEGDGIALPNTWPSRLAWPVRTHERFGTAMVLLPDGFKIDIATARLEYYEYPAALPTVELSSIKLDLYRRDFTINAMAIQLNPGAFRHPDRFLQLPERPQGSKSIKVLHNLSFVEDPSRIFRAIRFEKRMDFEIARHTERLINNAVSMKLFGKRRRARGSSPNSN